MKKIFISGVTVLDFIFHLDAIPRVFEKYRTKNAFISGGGNAANASVAISKLGGKAYLASRIGDDELSKIIINDLKKDGVNLKFLKICKKKKTSFSSVYINENGERQVVNFADSTMPLSCNWIKNLPNFNAYLTDAKWIEGALFTLRKAKINNVPGIIDIEEKIDINLIKNASHITFSLNGLRRNTSITNIKNALKKIRNMTSSWICVTDGENGVYFFEQNKIINLKPKNINAKDTLGAGDVWHGAFALSLSEGKNEYESVIFANTAATIKCKGLGGRESYPLRSQLERFF